MAAGLQMALACTTGAPAETAIGSFRGSTDRRLFLVAVQQKEEIAASDPKFGSPSGDGGGLGFRVASLVPEPGPGLLGMTAVLSLAASRRRCANQSSPAPT